MSVKVIFHFQLYKFLSYDKKMSQDQDQDPSFLDKLSQDLGIGTSVEVRHLPKHARQRCDVIYGPPAPLSGVLPVVSRTYTPLKLRELCSALVVANTSPSDLQA
jgi:hypothetical protein